VPPLPNAQICGQLDIPGFEVFSGEVSTGRRIRAFVVAALCQLRRTLIEAGADRKRIQFSFIGRWLRNRRKYRNRCRLIG
jgi:hypothetical protein